MKHKNQYFVNFAQLLSKSKNGYDVVQRININHRLIFLFCFKITIV